MIKNVDRRNATTECPYCGKTFKVSGLQGHITAKHMYDLWKAAQAK